MKKNIFKKIIITLPITLILIGFLLPISFNFAEVITPCVPPAVQVTLPDGNTACQDNTYHFLAPLPCDTGPGCVGGKLETFDPTGDNKIGAYLNVMIRIFIGICAVLAVIMIVMGGIEYMTSELISNKENGKHHITGAIFGLLLALGAWTILNQINPDILNTDLSSLQNVEVTVTVDESPATAVSAGSTETSAGMTNASGIIVNNNIAAGVNNLMAKARADGISLTGGGFRSKASQTALRVKNCNGDTTSPKPNPPCNPPTALPGNSMHESGQAIDFRCSGALIETRDNQCFIWLKNNASNYGLSNLATEPWHWSTNGR